MEPKCTFAHSQEPSNCPYSETDQCRPQEESVAYLKQTSLKGICRTHNLEWKYIKNINLNTYCPQQQVWKYVHENHFLYTYITVNTLAP
jgi:hypothetical protein